MSQPLKRKRADDDAPPVKNSRRRMDALEATDLAEERFAEYSQSRPVSIRLYRLSTIHRPRFLTHRRA